MNNYNLKKGKKIIVSEKNKIHQINLEDIIFIHSESGISTINKLDRGKLTFAKNLSFFEKQLENIGFAKANRNKIVNCAYISSFNFKNKQIKLCNNDVINISRRNLNKFIIQLQSD